MRSPATPFRFVAFLALAVYATTTLACAPAVDIHAIRSPTAHFERYRTLRFDTRHMAPTDYALSPRSVQVQAYVQETAAGILRSRGYEIVPASNADLVVVIEAGRRERKVVLSPPLSEPPLDGVSTGVSGPMAPSGASETRQEGAPGMETYHGQLDQEERDLVEGAFVIDAFEGESRGLVWHGAARAEITSGPIDYERVRRAVDSVLASFPARSSP